jgi:hypothetical protein
MYGWKFVVENLKFEIDFGGKNCKKNNKNSSNDPYNKSQELCCGPQFKIDTYIY